MKKIIAVIIAFCLVFVPFTTHSQPTKGMCQAHLVSYSQVFDKWFVQYKVDVDSPHGFRLVLADGNGWPYEELASSDGPYHNVMNFSLTTREVQTKHPSIHC